MIRVSPYTAAVAAMNRSAGSWWGSCTDRLCQATSLLSGASLTGNDRSTFFVQETGSSSSTIRPFSARIIISQTEMGEIHISLAESLIRETTAGDRRSGSRSAQRKMWVSRRYLLIQYGPFFFAGGRALDIADNFPL